MTLTLIRHAPSVPPGRLYGRTDAACRLPPRGELRAVAALAGSPGALLVSPARRCRETAAALFPGVAATVEPALWEQDFGAWDGAALADLPDLGPLERAALAAHAPPGGESFAAMAARARPALRAAAEGEGTVVVAHAGTVRAALGLALGDPALGLAFAVAPLSVTRLLPGPDPGGWGIDFVNRAAIAR